MSGMYGYTDHRALSLRIPLRIGASSGCAGLVKLKDPIRRFRITSKGVQVQALPPSPEPRRTKASDKRVFCSIGHVAHCAIQRNEPITAPLESFQKFIKGIRIDFVCVDKKGLWYVLTETALVRSSLGNSARISRRTDSPPTPESNTPIGASTHGKAYVSHFFGFGMRHKNQSLRSPSNHDSL